MSRPTFNAKHDQHTADTTIDPVDRVGRCRAHGCPNIWTTESSQLCRWHSAAEPQHWPGVTESMNTQIALNAIERQKPKPPQHRYTLAEKREILESLRALFTIPGRHPKQWAWDLKARDDAGESLTPMQRTAYRAVTGRAKLDAARDGFDVPFDDITDALHASGDLP